MKGFRWRPNWFSFVPGILHNNSHSMTAIIISKIAKNPGPRILHLHNRGNSLGYSQPKHGNLSRCRHRIAVERNNFEDVPRKRKTANLCRTAVQNMK